MGGSLSIVCLVAKPGEANGNASTNCVAVGPQRTRRDEENFLLPRWLPRRRVPAMKVHLASGHGSGDFHQRQPAVSLYDLGDSGDAEPAVEFLNGRCCCHVCSFFVRHC